MTIEHLRAEYARQMLVKMGVIKDYGPINPSKPVPVVILKFDIQSGK